MAVRTFDPQPIFMNVLPAAFEWAVDGYIPEYGITCFLGKPGSCKTFATVDAACCMATGLDCWGQRVGPPRKVIYIAADAGRGAELRIIAWVTSHLDALKAAGIELVTDAQGRQSLPNLLLYPHAVNLDVVSVNAAMADIKAKGLSADVICVDTLFHSSGKAKRTAPEDLLPVLGELQRLMEALGAKTCLLVHHTTKDGEEYFGTVAFLASVEAMILFKVEEGQRAAVNVSCMRMREGEAFESFEIKLQKVTVKTRPDKWGREEQEMLAVIPGTGPVGSTKKDEQIDFMESVLAIHCRNKATYAEWRDKMFEMMPEKKDKTGKVKPGLSERTFDRWLELIVARGHVRKSGDGEGALYSIVAGAWAGLGPYVAPITRPDHRHNHRHPSPLVGGDGNVGGLGPPLGTVTPPTNENSGASPSVTEEALALMLESANKGLEKTPRIVNGTGKASAADQMLKDLDLDIH
jgi:hypothetical protein